MFAIFVIYGTILTFTKPHAKLNLFRNFDGELRAELR